MLFSLLLTTFLCRRLLRFTTEIVNVGRADLVLPEVSVTYTTLF